MRHISVTGWMTMTQRILEALYLYYLTVPGLGFLGKTEKLLFHLLPEKYRKETEN